MAKKALAGEIVDEEDEDELLDLFFRVGSRCVPAKDEIRSALLNAAHKEILQVKYALDCMTASARASLQLYLPDASSTIAMLDAKRPTTRKVISCCSPHP